jgi:hypothetical protein
LRYLITIPQFIQPIVEGITQEININSVLNLGNGLFELETKCDNYLTFGKKAVIQGNDYEVSSINPLVVKALGNYTPLEGSFFALSPTFAHGTARGVKAERAKIQNTPDKLPLVYLAETIKEKYSSDIQERNYLTTDLTIFILDESNYEDNLIKDYYEDVIQPMRVLCELLIQALEEAKGINQINSFEIINHTKFATYIQSKGYEENVFCENLTGVQLNISISFTPVNCKC